MRGTFVHEVCAALDDRDFDASLLVLPEGWDEADRQAILGRAEAYQAFLDQTGFEMEWSELLVWCERLGVAGRLDRYGRFTKGKFAGQRAVVDIKSGLPEAAAQLQVALYDLLLRSSHPSLPPPNLRVVLHVKPNGKPAPIYRQGAEARNDEVVALSAVNLYQWKVAHA